MYLCEIVPAKLLASVCLEGEEGGDPMGPQPEGHQQQEGQTIGPI